MRCGKKFLSVLVSVMLAVGLCPGFAFAEGFDLPGDAADQQTPGVAGTEGAFTQSATGIVGGLTGVTIEGSAFSTRAADAGSIGCIDAQAIETLSGKGEIAQIALGAYSSAALMSDGTLWTWGKDGKSPWGPYNINTYDGIPAHSTPVVSMYNVKQVSVGYAHFAALKDDGSLWMWGYNRYGQVGNGKRVERGSSSAPTKIMDDVAQVSLGYHHSAAVKTDGSLWAWGFNGVGQVGDFRQGKDLIEYCTSPMRIMSGVAQVSLGYLHSAAIMTDGSLETWGDNDCGQLGDGTTERHYSPAKVMDGVAQVSLGDYHSAAIMTDGSLEMWGSNFRGQLGDGTTENRHSPVKVMDGVAQVSLGYDHSAAVKTDGSLWTWGRNIYGKLGNGTQDFDGHPTPAKIMTGANQVSLGNDHSAAVKADGSLWMWGDNGYGQLGDGTTTGSLSPSVLYTNGEWINRAVLGNAGQNPIEKDTDTDTDSAGDSQEVLDVASDLATPPSESAPVMKSANTLKVKAKTITTKAGKKKIFKASKAFKVTGARGKVTYKVLKYDKKAKKKITVAKNGKVVVKKSLKAGAYKVKVRVSAAGDDAYKSAAKVVTLRVKAK